MDFRYIGKPFTLAVTFTQQMTNSEYSQNRYRVSSRFIFSKVLLSIALLLMAYQLANDIFTHTFARSFGAQIAGMLTIVGVLYLLRKVKIIEYDDIKCILYVHDAKSDLVAEIPVANIEKILYSSVGFGNGSHSYLIIYRDSNNERKKVRLFPILLSNHIATIIADTKLRNPDLVTRNWSVGWNELSD